MVAVASIACLLIGLTLPAIQSSRESARLLQSNRYRERESTSLYFDLPPANVLDSPSIAYEQFEYNAPNRSIVLDSTEPSATSSFDDKLSLPSLPEGKGPLLGET